MAINVLPTDVVSTQYTRSAVDIPPWVLDCALPFLNAEQILVLLYVHRVTWGVGLRYRWVNDRKVGFGRVVDERRLDWGIQRPERKAAAAMQYLIDVGLVIVHREKQVGRATQLLISPGWYNEVDWDLVISNGAAASVGATRAKEGILATYEERGIKHVMQIGDEEAGIDRDRYFEAYNIKTLSPDDDQESFGLLVDAGVGMKKRPVSAVQRTADQYKVTTQEVVALIDAVLDVTGKTAVAAQDTPKGDEELEKARNTAISLMALGHRTPNDIYRLTDRVRISSNFIQRVEKVVKAAAEAGRPITQQDAINAEPIYPGDLVNVAGALHASSKAAAGKAVYVQEGIYSGEPQRVGSGRVPGHIDSQPIVGSLMDFLSQE